MRPCYSGNHSTSKRIAARPSFYAVTSFFCLCPFLFFLDCENVCMNVKKWIKTVNKEEEEKEDGKNSEDIQRDVTEADLLWILN